MSHLRLAQPGDPPAVPPLVTDFPDLTRNRLSRIAKASAEAHAFGQERYDWECTNLDRASVNYLRHECTNYEEDPSGERHRMACDAIADRYPWLASEARRQRDARVREDRELDAMRTECRAEQQRFARQRVADSKDAITAFAIGDLVSFRNYSSQTIWRKGRGVIVKVARTKVTVEFEDSGVIKQRALHASRVTALGGNS